jgi:hypothetical protein
LWDPLWFSAGVDKMARPRKLVSAPKAAPQVVDRKSLSVKRLLWRKRGKAHYYDGLTEDVAQNNLELRDVQDLLRQAA